MKKDVNSTIFVAKENDELIGYLIVNEDGGKYSTVVRKTVNNAKVGKSYHLDSSI